MRNYNSEDTALLKRGLTELANADVDELIHKRSTYGESWCKRGGVGAFMMLARKWDRIENTVQTRYAWDVLEGGVCEYGEADGLMDDIADLRRYLLLVEEKINHVVRKGRDPITQQERDIDARLAGAGTGYVNQDRDTGTEDD